MTAEVIEFMPDNAWTEEEQESDLLDLHERLSDALANPDRPDLDKIEMVLSIDNVMQLCELIEQRLGPEWFNTEIE